MPAAFDGPGYGLDHNRLGEYVAAVRAAAAAAPGIRVLAGIEVDYVPGTEDEIAHS